MDHGLGIISPRLEILEIEVFNIIYNPGNIGKRIFLTQSYPGNIGKRMFSIFSYPGNIWRFDFSHFLILLKTFFDGGPGGQELDQEFCRPNAAEQQGR